MALDVKPKGEIISHSFSIAVNKQDGDEYNHAEIERRLAEFMKGFIECYPHYIEKRPFKGDIEHWIFKFWIEKGE